ncbi:aminotransferase class I/II-fold pyridoxal phosphate-dependent enzyme [Jatrophihabitans sp.]|jgi:aspartate/methionine/tyrosine aminotransferase|uniref:aminotransferase class I/II-fold pyridoxal phosphate-dependent enzyme n=1 Tax=Jatrophihabitans sp. TaxID=1932789 RepID=UPI002EEAA382
MVRIANPPAGAAPAESVFVRIPAAAVRHGAVNLAQGVFDHGPPEQVLAALAEVGAGGEHQYAPSAGHPLLRAALARRYGPLDPDTEITVCAGATEAYYSTMAALISPGDEAIVVEPAYEQYAPVITGFGGIVRPIRLGGLDARLDAATLAAVTTAATKAIVVNSPWNPFGRSLDDAEWQAVAELADRGIVVVSDETYEHLNLDGREHRSVLDLVGDPELRVKISSASKTLAVTGWRVGWAIAGPGLTRRIRAAHQFVTFCPPTPLQLAVARVLDSPDFDNLITGTVAGMSQRVHSFVDTLTELGIPATVPESGFYVLADVGTEATAWCERMLVDQGVAGLPLSVFYSQPMTEAATVVRFALCKQPGTLAEASRRLRDRLGKGPST